LGWAKPHVGAEIMRFNLTILRGNERIRTILAQDGWILARDLAGHPQLSDERAARERLAQLGLLTSPAVRIEFLPQTFTESSN
jgi:hypothetical protein